MTSRDREIESASTRDEAREQDREIDREKEGKKGDWEKVCV